ncbi:MAG: helix-turn-helix domain-containing protein [bacterium]|nr:helix-turn-helix domain-containing protein [bacterium]
MIDLTVHQIQKALGEWKALPTWLKKPLPIGKQLIMLRNALGFTQSQVGRRIRTNQRNVLRLEKEGVDPRLSTLKKLAEALECELLIRLVPKKDIEKLLREKAQEKAKKLVEMSASSAGLELQKPSQETIQFEIDRLSEEILKNKRSSLWDDE